MTTFTDKELIKEIKERIGSLDVRDNIERRAYEIALASLEAEPIAWECGENIILFNPDTVEAYAKRAEISPKPLFAAPPVPVVPDSRPSLNNGIVGFDEGWNACRAAMRQGTEPVSQTYKLNELPGNYPVTPDGWISCSKRTPENIPGSCKEYLVFDALNNKVHHDYWVVPDGDSAPVASFCNHYGAHVTHWMPLPEPPQEVNRG